MSGLDGLGWPNPQDEPRRSPVPRSISAWEPDPKYDHCCFRLLDGRRVAFIEKSPRVLNPTTGEWEYGPKGAGGSGNSEKQQIYGFYPPSREWADNRLRELYPDVMEGGEVPAEIAMCEMQVACKIKKPDREL